MLCYVIRYYTIRILHDTARYYTILHDSRQYTRDTMRYYTVLPIGTRKNGIGTIQVPLFSRRWQPQTPNPKLYTELRPDRPSFELCSGVPGAAARASPGKVTSPLVVYAWFRGRKVQWRCFVYFGLPKTCTGAVSLWHSCSHLQGTLRDDGNNKRNELSIIG